MSTETTITSTGDGTQRTGIAVLVVEDDQAMAVALKDGFEYEGYDVTMARDGAEGLELARSVEPDLIILDVMLPRMSGLDVCKQLRSAGDQVPIIMLTARGQEIDKVLGLKLGADDYVTKPFSFMELVARAEAVLRRSGAARADSLPTQSCTIGDVTVDFDRHEATKAGAPLEMSPRELRLLRFLLEHRGNVVTREQLLDGVWGYDTIPFTRTVDTHIAKLRKKIEDEPSEPRYIITVHGVGYKLLG
jgi:DNA-binding response OmpR family regulator